MGQSKSIWGMKENDGLVKEKAMKEERKNELLDIVQKYNNLLRAETKGMTLEDTIYLLKSHITAVSGALSVLERVK